MSVEIVSKEDSSRINSEQTKFRKCPKTKKAEKTYTVTITYIDITPEEAKIKRAIIESIMKKGYKK